MRFFNWVLADIIIPRDFTFVCDQVNAKTVQVIPMDGGRFMLIFN